MSGANGVYELVYFERDSRSIARFKKAATDQERFIKSSNDRDIEKLVSPDE